MKLKLAIILSTATLSTSPAAAQIVGRAKAVDGDTLIVGSQEVRLHGIDAPERAQTCTRNNERWTCGMAAQERLASLIADAPVTCDGMGQDRYGRTLARCSSGAVDLNRTMVATGYAVAYRRYSMDYVSAEESAKASRRGIWLGSFELPSEFRHEPKELILKQPASERPARSKGRTVVSLYSESQGNCRIKGNRSRKGELIYHLPGRPYYDETRAEQMFCSEVEAREAGYRRSRAH